LGNSAVGQHESAESTHDEYLDNIRAMSLSRAPTTQAIVGYSPALTCENAGLQWSLSGQGKRFVGSLHDRCNESRVFEPLKCGTVANSCMHYSGSSKCTVCGPFEISTFARDNPGPMGGVGQLKYRNLKGMHVGFAGNRLPTSMRPGWFSVVN